jgi:sugar-specific transcriptional regulator TrmB
MADQDEENQALLTKLGFTTSQAKIYLALHKLGPSTVKTVAKTAKVDRGETYRVISTVEEKGFLEKMLVSPLKYKAIPIGDLMPILLRNRKDEITIIEKQTKHLIQSVMKKDDQLKLEEEYIIHVPQLGKVSEEIKRGSQSTKRYLYTLITKKSLQSGIRHGEEPNRGELLERGVKMITIVHGDCKRKDIPNWMKELTPHPNFSLRYVSSACAPASAVEFVVGDDKEVWIKTSGDVFDDRSSWLASNNRYLIALIRNYFERILQDSKPVQLKEARDLHISSIQQVQQK